MKMIKYISSYLCALCILISFSACEREEDINISVLEYTHESIITTYCSANITCALKCAAPFKYACVQYALNPEFTDYKTCAMTRLDSLWHASLTMLEPDTIYYVRYEISNRISSLCSEQYSQFRTITSGDGNEKGYIYVDLGLSVKWATCNVGAIKSNEYGDYFAWGETTTKSTYDLSSYKWYNGRYLTKYNTTITLDMGPNLANAIVTGDYKNVLESVDDVATVKWGKNWHTPTDAEWTELRENCTWTWITLNGIKGYLVTSNNNGNNIFLPATGFYENSVVVDANKVGFYWSSSCYLDESLYAYEISFDPTNIARSRSYRYRGYPIRPVYDTRSLPVVTTAQATEITENSAVIGGQVVNDGNTIVTERGVVYSIVSNPVINNIYHTTVKSGSGTGSFSVNLTNLVEGTTYYVRAYAVNSVGVSYGSQVSFTTNEQSSTPNNGTENGYEYVDLGLSVKWATCNVGATKPEEYGDYFAWGETQPKSTYDWSTYKWCNGSIDTQTKYCTKSSYGTVDNKTTLELSDDAARANWGGSWRMPTDAELTELREQCTWTWTTQNGVYGYKVTSKKNGNSIFLPAAGYRSDSSLNGAGSGGYYWSSSLSTDDPYVACSLSFISSRVDWGDYYRDYGRSVRPVCQ